MTIFGSTVPISLWTGATLVLGTGISVLAAPRLAIRTGWHKNALLATLLLLTASLAATLTPGTEPRRGGFHPCLSGDSVNLVHGTFHSTGGLGTTLVNLFVLLPVTCFAVLATKRVSVAALVAFLLPLIIETTQMLIPGRHCSVPDMTTKLAGAFLGVGIGYLLLHHTGRHRPDGTQPGRPNWLHPLT